MSSVSYPIFDDVAEFAIYAVPNSHTPVDLRRLQYPISMPSTIYAVPRVSDNEIMHLGKIARRRRAEERKGRVGVVSDLRSLVSPTDIQPPSIMHTVL